MADNETLNPISIGLDDGYAFTKIALPDGRLIAIPSWARIGRSNITWLNASAPRVFEYETDDTRFAVGEVDGEPTHFDGYPFSGLNRAIVQHALHEAGLAGQSVHAVSGLPVSSYYLEDGAQRLELIERKRASLKQTVQPSDGRLPAAIAFHEVIPEALAAWYDHVICEANGGVQLEAERLGAPVAVIDIGGRTTDFVVVAGEAVRHDSSGSLRCGLLDLKRQVAAAIRARFDLEELSEQATEEAVRTGVVRLFGKSHDVADQVRAARRELVERLHAETERQLGRGAELERILFVGGGALALADDIQDWFSNQAIAPHPAFANARGMLKYLRYVCQEPA
ncbi:MAG: ParM/StbA family protein [Nitrococcus sp.]|nr:ParM/StbA family protein [Nitrococcus sp.]